VIIMAVRGDDEVWDLAIWIDGGTKEVGKVIVVIMARLVRARPGWLRPDDSGEIRTRVEIRTTASIREYNQSRTSRSLSQEDRLCVDVWELGVLVGLPDKVSGRVELANGEREPFQP